MPPIESDPPAKIPQSWRNMSLTSTYFDALISLSKSAPKIKREPHLTVHPPIIARKNWPLIETGPALILPLSIFFDDLCPTTIKRLELAQKHGHYQPFGIEFTTDSTRTKPAITAKFTKTGETLTVQYHLVRDNAEIDNLTSLVLGALIAVDANQVGNIKQHGLAFIRNREHDPEFLTFAIPKTSFQEDIRDKLIGPDDDIFVVSPYSISFSHLAPDFHPVAVVATII